MPVVVLVAAMTAIPASATWSSAGNYEPDSVYDDPTLLWADAPNETTNRVYFNGFTGSSIGLVGFGTNPNVAALESRVEVMTIENYAAILGVWVDCNGDGYIGLAESAVREYPSSVLLDESLCPANTGDVDAWDGSPNYNGWVTELIPIGGIGGVAAVDGAEAPDPEDDGFDLRVIRDTSARVWADYGLYNEAADVAGGTCPVAPLPHGTLWTTGGLLDYADCGTGTLEAFNTIVNAAGDPAGLAFADPDDGRSGTLGRLPLLGDESADKAVVGASDCVELFNSNTFLNETLGEETAEPLASGSPLLQIWNINPTVRTDDVSVAGQVNDTNSIILDDCDPNTGSHPIYGLAESDHEGVDANDKRAADLNFEFEDSGRVLGSFIGIFIDGQVPGVGRGTGLYGELDVDGEEGLAEGVNLDPFFLDTPFAGPTGPGASTVAFYQHEWAARGALIKAGPSQALDTRGSLQEGNLQCVGDCIDRGYIITYYAYVDPAVLSDNGLVAPGGSGVYGSTQCGTNFVDARVSMGWQCDASLWYRNAADGTPQPETEGGSARPGAVYNFRDVDCQDGGNNAGIPLGIPMLGDEPCLPYGFEAEE